MRINQMTVDYAWEDLHGKWYVDTIADGIETMTSTEDGGNRTRLQRELMDWWKMCCHGSWCEDSSDDDNQT